MWETERPNAQVSDFQLFSLSKINKTNNKICLSAWNSHVLFYTCKVRSFPAAPTTQPHTMRCCHPTPSGFSLPIHGNIWHGPELHRRGSYEPTAGARRRGSVGMKKSRAGCVPVRDVIVHSIPVHICIPVRMNILMTGRPNQGCAPIKIVNECPSREKKISAPDSKSKVVGEKIFHRQANKTTESK